MRHWKISWLRISPAAARTLRPESQNDGLSTSSSLTSCGPTIHKNHRALPVEITGGHNLHLGDLFKFYGWTRYLGLPAGQFVHREPFGRADEHCLAHIAKRTGIDLVHVKDIPQDLDRHLDAVGLPKPAWDGLPDLWRFSFWAQRELLKRLRAERKKDEVIRQTVVQRSHHGV